MKNVSTSGRKNLVGLRLKAARQKGRTSMSQQELAARMCTLGVPMDRTTISKIEAGNRAVTDYELFAFSRALGVPVDWMFKDVSEEI